MQSLTIGLLKDPYDYNRSNVEVFRGKYQEAWSGCSYEQREETEDSNMDVPTPINILTYILHNEQRSIDGNDRIRRNPTNSPRSNLTILFQISQLILARTR